MSHRIWEGIRHDEYRFTDLPKVVRDKEEDRVYAKLTSSSKAHESLEQIPETDRADLSALTRREIEEEPESSNRDSFRRNVSLGTSSAVQHAAAMLKESARRISIWLQKPLRKRLPKKDSISFRIEKRWTLMR